MNQQVSKEDVGKMASILAEAKQRLGTDTPELKSRRSFAFFNEYIGDEPNAPHHTVYCDALQSWSDVIGILPRSSAKTTVGTVRYPSWRLGTDRGLRIIIASITSTLAEAASRNIDTIFKHERYRAVFGNLMPQSHGTVWNTVEKIVTNRPLINSLGYRVADKDASVFVVGVGGSIVGRRSDLIVIDDIIDRRSARSEASRADVRHWINEELLGSRHKKTQIVLQGTRFSGRDIYIERIVQAVRGGDYTLLGNMVERLMAQVASYEEDREMN